MAASLRDAEAAASPERVRASANRCGGGPVTGTSILTDAQMMDMSGVLCISERNEKASPCRDPASVAAGRIETSGGHHFDGDYQRLARPIFASIWRADGA